GRWRATLSLATLGGLVVAIERLTAGAHWPSDVAAGALLGGIAGIAGARQRRLRSARGLAAQIRLCPPPPCGRRQRDPSSCRSERPTALDHADQDDDDRHHEEDVDEPSDRVRADEANRPEHDQDERDRPQHAATLPAARILASIARHFPRGKMFRVIYFVSSTDRTARFYEKAFGARRMKPP